MYRFFLVCIIFILCLLSGFVALWIVPGTYQVHYHANFLVFIDGQRVDFSDMTYMEETSRCNVGIGVQPQDRIHLHDSIGDLIHVHMAASTWADLFANLGWNISAKFIVPRTGDILSTGSGKVLLFFLNGELVEDPSNTGVQSEDRLLIWYGTGTTEQIQQQFYPEVSSSAIEYNKKDDPASCSSNAHANIWNRIKEFFPHSHE